MVLHKKIIDKCNKIAKKEGVKLKNNFKKKSQKLLQSQHNRTHSKIREKALFSAKELKRLAGVIHRDLERKLNTKKHDKTLELFHKILSQGRTTKNKIYSTHEIDVHNLGVNLAYYGARKEE